MDESERKVHPQSLPNCAQAEIKREKLEGYALNPAHDIGKHKAQVFKNVLGFDQSDWELLKQEILQALPYYKAVSQPEGPWGKKYEVVVPITGPNGQTANVETAWIIRPGTDYPSLVTALIPKKRSEP